MSFYILQDNEPKGPFTIGQMRSMWNSGVLNLETKFCQEGDSEWTGISVLMPLLEPPPTVSPTSPATQPSVQDSDWGSAENPAIVRETPVGFLGKRGTIFGTLNLGCAGIVIILITAVAVSLSGC